MQPLLSAKEALSLWVLGARKVKFTLCPDGTFGVGSVAIFCMETRLVFLILQNSVETKSSDDFKPTSLVVLDPIDVAVTLNNFFLQSLMFKYDAKYDRMVYYFRMF